MDQQGAFGSTSFRQKMGVRGEDYYYTSLQQISGALQLRGAWLARGPKQPMAVMFTVDTFIARGPFHSKGKLAKINVLPVSVVRMGKFSDNAP